MNIADYEQHRDAVHADCELCGSECCDDCGQYEDVAICPGGGLHCADCENDCRNCLIEAARAWADQYGERV